MSRKTPVTISNFFKILTGSGPVCHVAIGKIENQTIVGCDELTLNSIYVAAPALRYHLLSACT